MKWVIFKAGHNQFIKEVLVDIIWHFLAEFFGGREIVGEFMVGNVLLPLS